MEYKPPEYYKTKFNCPHCNAYSHQKWYDNIYKEYPHSLKDANDKLLSNLRVVICQRCEKYSIWVGEVIVYPNKSTAPLPIDGMPDNVREIYNEARDILDLSPRAVCGLLRLATEKLLNHLETEGRTINDKIGKLVEEGLPPKIQQALDSLRVIGNEAVHDGVVDLTGDKETAIQLFNILNFVVYDRINRPQEIESIYGSLPKNIREGIENRDKNTNNP